MSCRVRVIEYGRVFNQDDFPSTQDEAEEKIPIALVYKYMRVSGLIRRYFLVRFWTGEISGPFDTTKEVDEALQKHGLKVWWL